MEIDTNLSNALVDMYAKCGDLEKAVGLFYGIPPTKRNASSWNALISGYDMHGFGKEALKLFSRMQEEGAEPNHITFTSILSACSHAGLIDEGRKCFADMKRLSVTLEVKHHACVVDMLGRAGLLQEAFDLIKEMPSPPSDGVWGALLLACKIHGNMEDQTNGKKLGQDMNNKGLKKPAAFSMIEYGKDILGFHTADQENPYRHEVYKKMESLAIEMKMAGYVPDLSCALHDVEEEDKEHMLNYHSEKLALKLFHKFINERSLSEMQIGSITFREVPVHVRTTGERWILEPCHP
ncbi:pentatricopeptide repeat-containing protein [Salix suchowensis]|nr:pentatricopeptide repeat-containing protein [Salix suchowensis]